MQHGNQNRLRVPLLRRHAYPARSQLPDRSVHGRKALRLLQDLSRADAQKLQGADVSEGATTSKTSDRR